MLLKSVPNTDNQRLLVIKNECSLKNQRLPFPSSLEHHVKEQDKPIVCQFPQAENSEALIYQLINLSLIFCAQSEANGGLLIHGALAEKEGGSIILAGHGNVGKSTASQRLPPPWQSLSDDCSLIVKDKKGKYRAHPWPTWSNFMSEKNMRSWDVQHSAPLKAIFILTQNATDKVEPIGSAQAVCMLNETVEQAWWGVPDSLETEKKQAMNLQRFNNICELVKSIPVFLLHISKTGAFWEEIEKVLPEN